MNIHEIVIALHKVGMTSHTTVVKIFLVTVTRKNAMIYSFIKIIIYRLNKHTESIAVIATLGPEKPINLTINEHPLANQGRWSRICENRIH